MAGIPTYIIGAGEVGIDVLCRIFSLERQETVSSRLGFLSIDSDRDTLAQTPNEMPDIYLGSDSGIVGEGREGLPYLTTDVSIPQTGANRLRHVGRYKLDNQAAPGFANHYDELKTRITRFFEQQQASLDEQVTQYNIIIINSLGGGTGSGIFPLLAGVLSHIESYALSDVDVRLLGIGVVPPLDVSPKYRSPRTESIAYPNTYGALRNLSSLLDATSTNPVRISTYAPSQNLTENTTSAGTSQGVESPTIFELDQSPFDRYWLVSMNQGGNRDRHRGSEWQPIAEMISGAVFGIASYTTPTADIDFWAQSAPPTPLGTLGYASLSVPHEDLVDYCQRKREIQQTKEHLETVISPRLDQLEGTHDEFESALGERFDEASPRVTSWVERIATQLDSSNDLNPRSVVKHGPKELLTSLERATDGEPLQRRVIAAKSLKWALTDGSVGSTLRSQIEELIATIRDGYEYQLTPDLSKFEDLERRLTILDQSLSGQSRTLQRRLAQADPSIRDLIPPTHEAFTSEREHLIALLDRLERDMKRVSRAKRRFDTVQTMVSLVDDHVRTVEEEARDRLETIEAELDHFDTEETKLQERLQRLEKENAQLRESLANPRNDGPNFSLPLAWDTVDRVTLSDVRSELTSISDYFDRDWLAIESAEIESYLEECFTFSRGWPAEISQHDISQTTSPIKEETFVIYHRQNAEAVEDFVESLTQPDELYSSSGDQVAFSENSYRIDIVSMSQGGLPESLIGFQKLQEMAEDGTFDAISGPYRDFRRALAYPEWYGPEIQEAFEANH